MTSKEYISSVVRQLSSVEHAEQSACDGAFLRAMLAVVKDVGSPLKEQTIVKLALLGLHHGGMEVSGRKKVA
jgi:hypothetical protein